MSSGRLDQLGKTKGLVQFREENGEFALATLSRYYRGDQKVNGIEDF
jgi:hypothetical protein